VQIIRGVERRRLAALLILSLAAAAAALMLWHHHQSWEYGLPVTIGSSSAEVERVLGPPTQTLDYDKELSKESEDIQRTVGGGHAGVIVNWYYTRGIVGSFKDGRLISIGVSPDNGDTYKGFLAYTGVIVRGLRITDNKETIFRTLGKPAKIESDGLPQGTDPNVPVVWPKGSRYYWRLRDCVVEVDFLDQAQSVDEEKHLTLPKDSVIAFQITK
jgi:hypothetical protein